MNKLALAALTLASSFAIANPVLPTPPAKTRGPASVFDCGTLNASQAEKLEKESPAEKLKQLAKTCEDQAMTFQKIAAQAKESLTHEEVTELYEKAANAQMYVANFTNTALFKN